MAVIIIASWLGHKNHNPMIKGLEINVPCKFLNQTEPVIPKDGMNKNRQ